jgi:hypothetical protein
MRKYMASITGTTALLMHNGQLADAMNEWVSRIKKITSLPPKQKTSEESQFELARLEFQGGLWYEDAEGPVIPGRALEAVLVEGARKQRLGKQFEAGVIIPAESYQLEYTGPRTREALWADPAFRSRVSCVVGQARVMRTRPIFRDWSCAFDIRVVDESLDVSQIQQALITAGKYVGIGDWRPRYGLFQVTTFEEVVK